MTTQSNERERQAAKKIVAPYMSIGVNTTGAKFAEHIAEALADVREQCAEKCDAIAENYDINAALAETHYDEEHTSATNRALSARECADRIRNQSKGKPL